ncbi:MAG TPA: MFS transporter [Candidatus Lumbricidophila sp.]|nr:MFS transporter [Candidatus Lumbricidophila sp.]
MKTLPPIPQPWRMWLLWAVGCAAYVLSVLNRTSLSAVGVDAAERFHADASTLSMFAVIQLAVYGAGQVPVGLLLDRFGARPIITAGMLLMAIGQATLAFAPQVGIAIAARVVLGAGDACVFSSVLRVIATWFPTQRAPVMVQLTGIIGGLGQLLSLLPLAGFVHTSGWTVAFGTLAGLGVLFAVLTYLVIRNRPPGREEDVSVNTATGAISVVHSSVDFRTGVKESWAHPGTRLGFWAHFTTPFAGSAFALLWGFPFLTRGQGLDTVTASLVISLYAVFSMGSGPVIGLLSARHPLRRTRMLVLPIIGVQALAWAAVLIWPGRSPLWLLLILAFTLAIGGPASLVAFDYTRTHNPTYRLSTATGIVNSAGFFAGLVTIFAIGVLMDVQGAGAASAFNLDAFKVAFLVQYPVWALGAYFIVRERHLLRVRLGLDAPRSRRR